jgi:nucleotide-binding universal stress UspA family protein
MYQRIVAGTDLSQTAKIATDRAAALTAALEAELVLVHAGSDPGETFARLADEYGAKAVVAKGDPAEVIIAQAEKVGADLIVVGSVGMRGAKRFLLGSVPNKVSHHSPTDLLIVKTDPPRSTDPYRRLMVGTDGSPTATAAVDKAASLARLVGAQMTVVCAYEPPSEEELHRARKGQGDPLEQWGAGRELHETPEEFRWRIASAWQAEDVLDRARDHAEKQGIEADVRALEGNAAEVLLSLGDEEGFDVIVVGNVGMSGAKRFMLGNVPHRISHHSPTDVLIFSTQRK